MIEKHLALSQKLDISDLDWAAARRAGLSPRERDILTYFADIEGQTVFYMIEVLKLKVAQDPDTLAFATIWNYEEYFHGLALARLLAECGCPLPDKRTIDLPPHSQGSAAHPGQAGVIDLPPHSQGSAAHPGRARVIDVRAKVRMRAKLEDLGQQMLARLCPRSFVALWMAWGASQEAMTLRGYDQLAAKTANPVLRTICERIAKQERRHFAWYYQAAREHLGRSRFSQRLVRFVFENFWTPVGSGVKSERQVAQLMTGLFSGDELKLAATDIDQRMSKLPGMEEFAVVGRWADELLRSVPIQSQQTPTIADRSDHIASA
jgi:hypothetical protein